jgi:hypothetical protein
MGILSPLYHKSNQVLYFYNNILCNTVLLYTIQLEIFIIFDHTVFPATPTDFDAQVAGMKQEL